MTEKVKKCPSCGAPIVGEPYRHGGKEYCRKNCAEYAALVRIEKAARMQTPWHLLPIIFALVTALAMMSDKAKAHEPYSGWTIPGQSKSCCNLTDCAITRAKFERGNWWAFVASKKIWVQVPEDRIVNYKTDDTEAHLCYGENVGEVYCFRPPKLGM